MRRKLAALLLGLAILVATTAQVGIRVTQLPAYPGGVAGTDVVWGGQTSSGITYKISMSQIQAFVNALANTFPANTVVSNFTNATGAAQGNTVPSCPDTSGNHLNYVNGTGLACGTSTPTTGNAPANTVAGNFTNASAAIANNAVPSCPDSGGNHINYVSGTGYTCGTTGTTNASNLTSGTLGAARLPAFGSGDVSFATAGGAGTIAANAVTNAKLAQAGGNTLKGNNTGSTANVTDIAVPNCPDTAGNHLNYTGGALSCGNTGGAGTAVASPFFPIITNDATTPNTVFDVSAGAAASDDASPVSMSIAAFTKTTGAWAVGSGNGCLDTGSVAPTTWYHVYEIVRIDTGVVDILCSTAISPLFPTSYTKKRRLSSILTNGSSNIVGFAQIGTTRFWASTNLDVNDSGVGTSRTLETIASVPPNVKVQPLCRVSVTNATAPTGVIIESPDEPDVAPTAAQPFAAAPGADFTTITDQAGWISGIMPTVFTNTAQQVAVRSSRAGTTVQLVCRGYAE